MGHTYLKVDNDNGLICGFRLNADGPADRITAAVVEAGGNGPVWLHFNLADLRAREWIARSALVPAAVRELLVANDHHLRFERTGNGVFAVVGDLHHDLGATAEALDVLRLYVDDRVLVTLRRHPLKSTDRVRRDLAGGMTVGTPVALLIHLLMRIADSMSGVLAEISDWVDDAEERVLLSDVLIDSRALGRMRRLLARLRRHMPSQRNIDLPGLLGGWCGKSEVTAFRRTLQRLDSIGQDLELTQVRARLLQEEIAARFGEATNRNIYFLSIVTALLLPISVVSGIFGMNVGGLPLLDHRNGFWLVIGVMVVSLGASVILLRRRGLL